MIYSGNNQSGPSTVRASSYFRLFCKYLSIDFNIVFSTNSTLVICCGLSTETLPSSIFDVTTTP